MKVTEITCRSCKETKPVSAYHVKTDNKSGYATTCKECRSKNAGHKPNFRTRNSAKSKPVTETPKITQEELIEEIHEKAAKYPHNRIYRKAALELSESNEEPISEQTQDILFRLWHKKVEATGITYILDETAPIITADKERTIKTLECTLKPSENRQFYSDGDRD